MKKILLLAVIPLLIVHCSTFFPKHSFNTTTDIIHTTIGQELIDLQEALDSGTITQEEHDELRKKIMERLDTPADSIDTN